MAELARRGGEARTYTTGWHHTPQAREKMREAQRRRREREAKGKGDRGRKHTNGGAYPHQRRKQRCRDEQ